MPDSMILTMSPNCAPGTSARRLLERAKKMTLTPGNVRYEPTVTLEAGHFVVDLILGMVAFYAINHGDTADGCPPASPGT